MPIGPDIRRVMDVYKLLGFNGAFGSIDCTYVAWRKCPVSSANFCIGKEKTPTLSFLCLVDHNKRIMICSNAYYGAANDKQIVKGVSEMQALFHGLLEDVSFKLYDDHGEELVLRGAYLVADGGFLQLGSIIDPGHFLYTVKQIRWNKFLESIRKDVDCTFGILKIRFRILVSVRVT